MPRKSVITSLPLSVQLELDERMRARAYTSLGEHYAWLEEKGLSCSRSALGRHMIALRKADAIRNEPRAVVASQKSKGSVSRDELLIELGRLHLEKERVIAQLMAMEKAG
jgi:hypothetical protein